MKRFVDRHPIWSLVILIAAAGLLWVIVAPWPPGLVEVMGRKKVFLNALFNGVTLGALYFLVASGFTLIFGLMKNVNLAHGSLYMLGGYIGYEVSTATGWWLLSFVVAFVVVALIGSSLEIVIIVLGFLIWDRFAVVMRSTTMQVRNLDYVAAAQAAGCSTLRIILTEIMPNIVNALIVVATVEVAHAIILEAALSFLGLGVQPPLPSWGLMVSEGKGLMFFQPWVIAIPGTALFVLILCVNLLGDGIRDVTAPENRN